MSRQKAPLPLTSYDPRYQTLLLAGAKERTELPILDYSKAVRLRQEIQQFRAAAKKHHGEANKGMWEPLYQAIVRIERLPEQKARLIIEPRGRQFEDVLKDVIAGPTAVAEGSSEPVKLDSLLDELEKQPPKEGENKS